MELAHVTFVVFTVFSGLRIVSYLPQIMKIAADKNGASAISYATWSTWVCTNLATAFYAVINLRDFYLTAFSGVSAACCAIVIILTIYKRTKLIRLRVA